MALLLALVGIYATLSLSVGQRSREFAIRMAVGADRLSITSLVLKHSLLMVMGAEVLGIAGALDSAKFQFLSTLLFGVKPMDPLTQRIVGIRSSKNMLLASGVTSSSETSACDRFATEDS